MARVIKQYPNLSGKLYHYNGEVILRFDPDAWQYFIESSDGSLSPIRGVTSTLKVIGGKKTDMLINWAVKKDFEKLMSLLADLRRGDGVFIDAVWEDIESIADRAKKEHRLQLETAGEIGHGAHAHLESIAKSLMAGDDRRLYELLAKWPEDPKSCNAAIAAVAFLSEHNVRFIDSERRVLSREWLVCGTMDGDALVDSCDNSDCSCARYAPFTNKRLVLDYKTSNGVYSSMFGQMALYRKAREEEATATGEPVHYDGSVLLRIGKDDKQEFEAFFTMGDTEYNHHLSLFKRALDLKESVDIVDDWMDTIRERAKLKRVEEKAARKLIDCGDSDGYKGVRRRTCGDGQKPCQRCEEIYAKYQSGKTS